MDEATEDSAISEMGEPMLVRIFQWQDPALVLDVFADANWAVSRKTRKSTSGGCAMLGYHCIKAWSKTRL